MKKLDENWQPLGVVVRRLVKDLEPRKIEKPKEKRQEKYSPVCTGEGEV